MEVDAASKMLWIFNLGQWSISKISVMTEYLKVQSTTNKCNNVMKLLTSHVEWICYAYHMELQSKDTPWSVEHQGETPMVSADPNDCPDLVAPGLTALLETHTDSNMCHHSFRNKQIDDEVSVENAKFGTVIYRQCSF
jgi:hypothetical protein